MYVSRGKSRSGYWCWNPQVLQTLSSNLSLPLFSFLSDSLLPSSLPSLMPSSSLLTVIDCPSSATSGGLWLQPPQEILLALTQSTCRRVFHNTPHYTERGFHLWKVQLLVRSKQLWTSLQTTLRSSAQQLTLSHIPLSYFRLQKVFLAIKGETFHEKQQGNY